MLSPYINRYGSSLKVKPHGQQTFLFLKRLLFQTLPLARELTIFWMSVFFLLLKIVVIVAGAILNLAASAIHISLLASASFFCSRG
jgi:predicted permease